MINKIKSDQEKNENLISKIIFDNQKIKIRLAKNACLTKNVQQNKNLINKKHQTK